MKVRHDGKESRLPVDIIRTPRLRAADCSVQHFLANFFTQPKIGAIGYLIALEKSPKAGNMGGGGGVLVGVTVDSEGELDCDLDVYRKRGEGDLR